MDTAYWVGNPIWDNKRPNESSQRKKVIGRESRRNNLSDISKELFEIPKSCKLQLTRRDKQKESHCGYEGDVVYQKTPVFLRL